MIDVDYNEYKATLEENMKLIQENHKLKEKAKEWQDISTRINEDNNRLNNIIDKAIEYIGNGNLGIPRKTRDKFIKILQGSDKE